MPVHSLVCSAYKGQVQSESLPSLQGMDSEQQTSKKCVSEEGGVSGGSAVKSLPAKAGGHRRLRLIPESGRSLEEEKATRSGILAWRIPWTEEPGGTAESWTQLGAQA